MVAPLKKRVVERCDNCRFSQLHVQESEIARTDQPYFCLRFPPSRYEPDDGWWEHPTVSESNWCGEWEAKR